MSLNIICGNLFPKLVSTLPKNVVSSLNLHTSYALAGKINRERDRKEMLKSVIKKSDGLTGVDAVDIDVRRLVLSNPFTNPNHIETFFHSQ